MKLNYLTAALLLALATMQSGVAQAQQYSVFISRPTLKVDTSPTPGGGTTPGGATNPANPSGDGGVTPVTPLPQLSADVSSHSLAFGNVALSMNQNQTVSFFNTGDTALNFAAAPYLDANSASAYVAATTCGASLIPGAACLATVTFTPVSIGNVAGTLLFATNAAGGPLSVALSGTGTGAHFEAYVAGQASTALPAFTNAAVGAASAPNTFQIRNTGNIAGTPSLTVSPSQFAVSGCASSIEPGASCTASVTFTPGDTTALSGVIKVAGSADRTPFNVDVSGTGSAVDASTWTIAAGTATGNKYSIAFGAGKFLTIENGTSTLTSVDGKTWKSTALPASVSGAGLQYLSYVNGNFVATGYQAGNGYSAISADGVTWTKGYLSNGSWSPPAYGAGRYVTVEASNNSFIASSADGVTWTTQSFAGRWSKVAFGAGKFIATPFLAGGSLAVSTNGTSWTTMTSPISGGGNQGGISFVNGRFVLVQGPKIATSTDGVTWTVSTSPVSFEAAYPVIAYGGGTYSITSSGTKGATSSDGINWKATVLPNAAWAGQAYGNGRFVIGGYNSSPIAYTPQ